MPYFPTLPHQNNSLCYIERTLWHILTIFILITLKLQRFQAALYSQFRLPASAQDFQTEAEVQVFPNFNQTSRIYFPIVSIAFCCILSPRNQLITSVERVHLTVLKWTRLCWKQVMSGTSVQKSAFSNSRQTAAGLFDHCPSHLIKAHPHSPEEAD